MTQTTAEPSESDGAKTIPLMGPAEGDCDGEREGKTNNSTEPLSPIQKRRRFRTGLLFVMFLVLGMAAGLSGPTFLDLQLITGVSTDTASLLFSIGSFGYMVGSFLQGGFLGRLPFDLVLCVTMTFSAFTTAAYPWCSLFPLMVAMSFLNSLWMGGFDTCGNAAMMTMWGKKSGSQMQTLHFCFSLGAMLSPFYTRPFLAPRLGPKGTSGDLGAANASCLEANETLACSGSNGTEGPWDVYGETRVQFAFLITACFLLAGAIPFLFLCVGDHVSSTKKEPEVAPARDSDLPLGYFLVGVVLLDMLYFVYNAAEESFTAFLTTFVVRQLDWSKGDGALLTSAFWACFSAGRFSGIFLQRLLKPITLLLVFCPLMALSLGGVLLSASLGCSSCVWVTVILTGGAMSIIFPTGLVFAEQELFPVSGRVISSVFVSGAAGVMINPLILGVLMERYTYMWYAYLLLAEAILVNVFLLVLILFGRLKLQKLRRANKAELSLEEPVDALTEPCLTDDGNPRSFAEKSRTSPKSQDGRLKSYLANWSDQYQHEEANDLDSAMNASRASSMDSFPSPRIVGRFYVRKPGGSPRKEVGRKNTARGRIVVRSKSLELLKS